MAKGNLTNLIRAIKGDDIENQTGSLDELMHGDLHPDLQKMIEEASQRIIENSYHPGLVEYFASFID